MGTQAALLVTVGAIAVVALFGVVRNASQETKLALDELMAVHRLRVDANELVADARAFLLTGDAKYRTRVEDSRERLSASLAAIRTQHAWDAVAFELAAYQHEVDRALRARDFVIANRGRVAALFEDRLAPRRKALHDALVNVELNDSGRVEALASRSADVAATAGYVVLAASACALLTCIVLAALVVRRLAKQFRATQEAQREASAAAASRRELLDVVSHDLRSPLSTIGLAIENLRLTNGDLPTLRPMENAVVMMQRLVDDLLDAARAQTSGLALEVSEVDTYDLLSLTVESFAAQARRVGVELRIEHPVHAEIVADRDRVLQILANLVGNALKVTPRGGHIVLAANQTTSGMRFSVHDTGPGITGTHLATLFDAYHQGATPERERVRGSLGLGLYISKELARAHGGSIGIDHNVSQGSTFWFELPRCSKSTTT